MREYNDLDSLWKDYIEKDKNGELARDFLKDHKCLTIKSLRAFFERYENAKNNKTNKGGAKFSERVFSYWTMKYLNKNGSYPKMAIQHKQKIKLCDGKNDEVYALKKFDFFFKSKKGKQVFIEFKCNIDNIEKDLYKFFLLKGDKSFKNAVTAIVIWEGEDHWKYKRKKNNGELSGYAKLLKDAKAKKLKLLDEHFYFPDENEQRANDEIEKYKHFLKEEIQRDA